MTWICLWVLSVLQKLPLWADQDGNIFPLVVNLYLNFSFRQCSGHECIDQQMQGRKNTVKVCPQGSLSRGLPSLAKGLSRLNLDICQEVHRKTFQLHSYSKFQ